MNRFFVLIIRWYKRYLSPFFAPACRFTPTCSVYAMEAFEKKSVLRALWMTVARIAKCHPFHPGGYDPVDPVAEQGLQEDKRSVDISPVHTCCKANERAR